MPADPIRLTLPLNPEEAKELRAGVKHACFPVLFSRCAMQVISVWLAEMGDGEELPYGLTGQTIFYAGPTPSAAGRPFGAIGPTTASRMGLRGSPSYGLWPRPQQWAKAIVPKAVAKPA